MRALAAFTAYKPGCRALAIAAASVVLLAVLATLARAVELVELHIESASGPEWSARDIAISMQMLERGQSATMHVASLKLAQIEEPLTNLSIDCPVVELSTQAIGCRDARIQANVPGLGAQTLAADLAYARADGAIDLRLRGLHIGTGTVSARAHLRDGGWSVEAQLREVSIEAALSVAHRLDIAVPISAGAGQASLEIAANGKGAEVSVLRAKGTIEGLTANNESGSIATDALTLRLDTTLSRVGSDWRYELDVHANAGQAYVEPIFVDTGVHALGVAARGAWVQERLLELEQFRIDHDKVLNASGTARVNIEAEQPLEDLELEIASLQFPGAYESYLQPFLLETSFKALNTSGALRGTVSIADAAPRKVDLIVQDISVDGELGALAIAGLGGEIHWDALVRGRDAADLAPVSPSHLHWQGGALYGLSFGASTLSFTTSQRNFRLSEPTSIPLLDGALQIDSLRIRNAGEENMAFLIDAVVQPISVPELCRAFGWPEFGGRVGGAITNLRMREGVVTLGTTLQAQVFDGKVTVKDLRLEQPFGRWPRFYSNIALDNLDLELLTSAFSFGRITGRLSGSIDGLELFAWSPVAFDAKLFTTPGDRSRHRISQRAVENIGSIGGGGAGVTAALSSGFLRFFDDFNYARLGISCKLENEVCLMGGVGPAPNGGYYLVQGRGLPRIDVIGNARRVDWPRLVQQLIAATESGGPTVN